MQDTVLGALQLSLIELGVVFLVLALLAATIKAVQHIVAHTGTRKNENRAPDHNEATLGMAEPQTTGSDPEGGDAMSDTALVAIISAAITTYTGDSNGFVVRSISPVAAENAWTHAGRRRLMSQRDSAYDRRFR